ncbi:peptidylprolyl isomerase [Chloroflexota bacterium]
MAKIPQKRAAPTKKHMARQERERRERNIIYIVSAVVIITVLALVLYGIIDQTFLKARRPVAIVNDETITVSEYQGQTRLARYNLIQSAQRLYQLAQIMGNDPSTQASVANQIQQIDGQLFPQVIGEQIIDQLVDDLLIQQEASRLGITISEDEVNQELEEGFGYYRLGTPTPTATHVLPQTSTLSPLQESLIPSTPTSSASIIPTSEITTTEIVEDITQSLESSPTPTNVLTPTLTATTEPTATPYTQQAFEEIYQDAITNLSDEFSISESDLKTGFESRLYSEKVMDFVTKDMECSQDQVWALHILVDGEELAKDIKTRLDEGEDWSSMATTYSIDTSNKDKGGDLGWFGNGVMVPEFEQAAFKLDVGETSEPVKTDFGFHIIRKLGHEERPLTEEACQSLRSENFQEWLAGLRENSNVIIQDFWIDVAPTEPNLPANIVQYMNLNLSSPPTPSP